MVWDVGSVVPISLLVSAKTHPRKEQGADGEVILSSKAGSFPDRTPAPVSALQGPPRGKETAPEEQKGREMLMPAP